MHDGSLRANACGFAVLRLHCFSCMALFQLHGSCAASPVEPLCQRCDRGAPHRNGDSGTTVHLLYMRRICDMNPSIWVAIVATAQNFVRKFSLWYFSSLFSMNEAIYGLKTYPDSPVLKSNCGLVHDCRRRKVP